jgi:TPR repeat protein
MANAIDPHKRHVEKLKAKLAGKNPLNEGITSNYWLLKNDLAEALFALGGAYEKNKDYAEAVQTYYESHAVVPLHKTKRKLGFLPPPVTETTSNTWSISSIVTSSVTLVRSSLHFLTGFISSSTPTIEANSTTSPILDETAHAQKLFQLGLQFRSGIGQPQSDSNAVSCFQVAAKLGHVSAQCNLAFMYRFGRGVPKNHAEAIKYYQLAVDKNDPFALLALTVMFHETGQAPPLNLAETARLFYSADPSCATVQTILGVIYYHQGINAGTNPDEALRFLRLAAKQGCTIAQYWLGYAYKLNMMMNPLHIGQNYAEAIRYFRLGADQEDSVCIENLANMYTFQYGPDDAEQAVLYRKDLLRPIPNALVMLKACAAANPDDFQCQYHLMQARFDHVNWLSVNRYREFDKLFNDNPDDFVETLLADELLSNAERKSMLLHIYELSNSAPKFNALVYVEICFYLGNCLYELLPKLDSDRNQQLYCAEQAIKFFRHIPADNKHYAEAAAAIMNMEIAFHDEKYDEQYQTLFADKGKLHPMDQIAIECETMIENKMREELMDYSAEKYRAVAKPRPSRKHNQSIKQLLAENVHVQEIMGSLAYLPIKIENLVDYSDEDSRSAAKPKQPREHYQIIKQLLAEGLQITEISKCLNSLPIKKEDALFELQQKMKDFSVNGSAKQMATFGLLANTTNKSQHDDDNCDKAENSLQKPPELN